jgi:ethanolamine utilization protein EutL
MSILERIRPSVCAVRLIASVQADFKAKLGLPDHFNSVGLLTADSDDVTYIAADEATKHAQVEVISGRSLYAGAAHGPSPTAGEVLIIFGGPTPAEVRSGLEAAIATIEDGPAFQWANADAYDGFPSRTSFRAPAAICRRWPGAPEPGGSLAYLIAPPLEADRGTASTPRSRRPTSNWRPTSRRRRKPTTPAQFLSGAARRRATRPARRSPEAPEAVRGRAPANPLAWRSRPLHRQPWPTKMTQGRSMRSRKRVGCWHTSQRRSAGGPHRKSPGISRNTSGPCARCSRA